MKVVYFGGEISYSVFSWKSLDMTFYFYIKWEPTAHKWIQTKLAPLKSLDNISY
jgi:hypothetical protein